MEEHQLKKIIRNCINVVENLTSQSFDKVEINLLNNDLNFGIPHSGKILDDIVGDVETSIHHLLLSPKTAFVNKSEIKFLKNFYSKRIKTTQKEA